MAVGRIDREPDDLHVALIEFRLYPRHVAEFGGAHRREILRVRKQNAPGIAEPVVKTDRALRRVGLKIGSGIAQAQCHGNLLRVGKE
jgi:hypothetical protein